MLTVNFWISVVFSTVTKFFYEINLGLCSGSLKDCRPRLKLKTFYWRCSVIINTTCFDSKDSGSNEWKPSLYWIWAPWLLINQSHHWIAHLHHHYSSERTVASSGKSNLTNSKKAKILLWSMERLFPLWNRFYSRIIFQAAIIYNSLKQLFLPLLFW